MHRDTLYEWARKNPAFSDAMKRARQNTLHSMMQIGLSGMTGKLKGFNAAAWIFWMKAQHNWDEAGNPEDLDATELEFNIT